MNFHILCLKPSRNIKYYSECSQIDGSGTICLEFPEHDSLQLQCNSDKGISHSSAIYPRPRSCSDVLGHGKWPIDQQLCMKVFFFSDACET